MVLRCIEDVDRTALHSTGTRRVLPVLRQTLSSSEVELLAAHFATAFSRHGLEIKVPSTEDWFEYQQHQSFKYPGASEPEGLFWVALQFFLLEEDGAGRGTDAASAMNRWIQQRADEVTDERIVQVIRSVAVLSGLRLPAPLWPTLRPAFGGRFSTDLTDTFQDLRDILTWEEGTGPLADGLLRFRHPALANAYLDSTGSARGLARLDILRPVLEQLSAGLAPDVYLAETLASDVIRPKWGSEVLLSPTDQLTVFSWMPLHLSEQSQTILHHWARALYAAAGDPRTEPNDRGALYREAVARLRSAIALPQAGNARREHPSHLWNTLGTAYVHWAQAESGESNLEQGQFLWNQAIDALDKAVSLGYGDNHLASLAYAQRLIERAKMQPSMRTREESLADVAEAITHLDQATEVLELTGRFDYEQEQFVAKQRAAALQVISDEEATGFIQELKERGNDIGFFCQAWLLLVRNQSGTALDVLVTAHRDGIELSPSALRLLLRLLREAEEKIRDYELELELLLLMERRSGAKGFLARDRFDCAVLCYQTDRFEEGLERFRRLRRYTRDHGVNRRARAVWRSRDAPHEPRPAAVRLSRRISDWSGYGQVQELNQEVVVRPRHFVPALDEGDLRKCYVRFEMNGPLAVPERFVPS